MTNPPTTQHLAGGPTAPQVAPLAGAVTILTAGSGKRATKIHRRDGQGGWVTQGYDRLKMFAGRVEEACDLRDFMAVLVNAARNPGSLVVAEAIRGDVNTSSMRRLTLPKPDSPPTLTAHPEGVRWICWEVDGIKDLPDWFDPNDVRARDRDDELAMWWIKANLPECFHDRSAILQWSSSALVGGKVSMHLWQWLDRPVSRDSIKVYAMAHWRGRLDVTVWEPARVHYIASPIFEAVDGTKTEDMLGPWRWQWVPGALGDVCEALPEWVDQPTWEQQLVDAKAEAARRCAEFASRPARNAGTPGEAGADETGAITPTAILPLKDLDPKRVLAWARGVGERCASQIGSAPKGERHLIARSYALFFGNILGGLDDLGAALSDETRTRVEWWSGVSDVAGALSSMEAAAVVAGEGDADRARVVRWAVEMGRLCPVLPDYRLKEKYRESAKQGGKVIPMKKRAGLPAYEDQPAVCLARVDGDGVVVEGEDGDDEMGSHAPPAVSRPEWFSLLQTTKSGKLSKTRSNFIIIAQNDPAFGKIRFNELSACIEVSGSPAWAPGVADGTRINDAMVTWMCLWLEECWEYYVSETTAWSLVGAIAHREAYDPLKEYLLGLKWDGVERIYDFATKYLNAEDTKAAHHAGAWWLMAAAKRALEPGCQSDYVLTLEGGQGLYKSQLLKHLCPAREHMMIFQGDPASPKAIESIRGKWLIELAELSVLGRGRDMRIVKGFITTEADDYRAPWARAPAQYLRRCAFLATVNPEGEGGYLADSTGNRRWWPVRILRPIDLDAIDRDRDQLWAEAVHRLGQGERHWPTPEEERMWFAPEQKRREDEDAMTDEVYQYAKKHRDITTLGVMIDVYRLNEEKCSDRRLQNVIGGILQRLGWQPRKGITTGARLDGRTSTLDGKRKNNVRWWQAPVDLDEEPPPPPPPDEPCPF